MHPVTTSRWQRPCFFCSAISRMALTDSCRADSMNAQVLTTRTSASAASGVSVCPACCARLSITSESTRFLGQPRETRPIFIQDSQTRFRSRDLESHDIVEPLANRDRFLQHLARRAGIGQLEHDDPLV